jgi:hypothetical protein
MEHWFQMEHWFRPMGLSLWVSTNSSKLAAAVCEAYDAFGAGEPRASADLRFYFTQRSNGSIGIPEYRMSMHRSELRMCGQVILSIEPERGLARGSFPEEFVNYRSSFRLHALHFALSAALAGRGFLGVHAACIVMDGRAVLLRGPHGAGKSFLAYAAASRGFRVLTDSTVWIAPDDTAWWGISQWIYLRGSARAFFAQIPAGPEVLIGDEQKIEVGMPQGPAGGVAPGIVVFLKRDSGGACRLEAISKAEALAMWDSGSEGNEASHSDYRARIARILDGPVYRLNSAGESDGALDLIAAATEDPLLKVHQTMDRPNRSQAVKRATKAPKSRRL